MQTTFDNILKIKGYKKSNTNIRFNKNFETIFRNNDGDIKFVTEMYEQILNPYNFKDGKVVGVKPVKVVVSDDYLNITV